MRAHQEILFETLDPTDFNAFERKEMIAYSLKFLSLMPDSHIWSPGLIRLIAMRTNIKCWIVVTSADLHLPLDVDLPVPLDID